MNESTANAAIGIAVQVPVVALFIWFILRRDEAHQKEQSLRDVQWMNFLREQREQTNEALSRLADAHGAAIDRISVEVKNVSLKVGEMSTILAAHDASSRTARIARKNMVK